MIPVKENCAVSVCFAGINRPGVQQVISNKIKFQTYSDPHVICVMLFRRISLTGTTSGTHLRSYSANSGGSSASVGGTYWLSR